jgi:hypothetical protein
VKLYCPGGGIIRYETKSLTQSQLLEKFDLRIKILEKLKSYNWAGSWYQCNTNEIQDLKEKVRTKDLLVLQNFKTRGNQDFQLRIEEPYINVYSNSESSLYELCSKYSKDRILEIHRPKNKESIEILDNGSIINKAARDFQYLVHLKAHRFDNLVQKHKLVECLESLRPDVRFSSRLKKSIMSSNYYFIGGQFYAKDDSTTVFIKLKFPELIGKIYTLSLNK